ncbi:DUF397 domain-containing protein [Actinomadura montaniterrae]|uniref:DUF397 domain-containing protein n=1 Tax=Actinomadura montaniterrae TaxID=1803903 RepID=A0A6L3VR71_9ACTN|nr:DUF397 domain-containing protein [Actinomadura montaniterrae]KAB2379102.1 DUF397 domain-containing protein [Actinomadura montaniterrae]
MPAWTQNDGRSTGDSHSGTPAEAWRRSTGCTDDSECSGDWNCVEVARLSPGEVGLRDSERPESVLPLSTERFAGMLRAIKERANR